MKEDPDNPCYGDRMSSWLIRQFSHDLTYIAGAYMDVKRLAEFIPKPCLGFQGLGLGPRIGFDKLSWDLEFGMVLVELRAQGLGFRALNLEPFLKL